MDGYRVGHWVGSHQAKSVTATKLTTASMLTDGERPDWLEVVAVFEVTPAQRAAFASLLHVEDGVRVTVEPADVPADAPPRSAEEIAREMVSEIDVAMSMTGPHIYHFSVGGVSCAYDDPRRAKANRKVAIEMLVATIERSRDDGAAAALAGQQPRDLAGRIRALVQKTAGEWVDAHHDGPRSFAYQETLRWLRNACCLDHRDPSEVVGILRQHVYGENADVYASAADELEAIVRECEEER